MLSKAIFGVLGGLGLFVFGMKYLSDHMQLLAGTRLRRILRSLTKDRVRGTLLGAFVTSIIQSSSVTTVILAGLLNAGLIDLMQSASVVIGANIGTTITAQIIAFKISKYAFPAIFIGTLMMLFAKKKRTQHIGALVFSFGLIFLGLETMSSVMKPLKDVPEITTFFVKLSHSPILCIILGTVFTVLVQSSSASIGMLIAMASAGLIDYTTALYFLLGDNIGTTITAWLASIGGTLAARRMACFHTIFNIVGATYFYFLIKGGLYPKFIDFITPGAVTADTISRHIANAHTLFNVFNALVFLPFLPIFVTLIKRLVPGKELYISAEMQYLQDRLLNTPEIAIDSAKKEIAVMAQLVQKCATTAIDGFFQKDKKSIQYVQTQESAVDTLQHDITYYLAKLSTQELSPQLANQLPNLLHSINDLERIADHAVNISELTERIISNECPFSNKALAEMRTMYGKVDDMFKIAISMIENPDTQMAEKAFKIEQEINKMQKDCLSQHSQRLCSHQCHPYSALIYVDFINNVEKMADHLTNIIEAFSHSSS